MYVPYFSIYRRRVVLFCFFLKISHVIHSLATVISHDRVFRLVIAM
jgi:hypothetical protein